MASPFDSLALLLVIAGAGLTLAEALIPGAHFIVVGIALLLAGLVAFLFPPLAQPFVLSFLVLAFGAISFYGYRHLDLYGGKGSGRTKDSDSLKGTTGHVTERVTRSEGQVKLDSGGFNPYYAARTMDGEIPEGTEVMVMDPGGGNVVTVEPVDFIEDPIDRELARGRTDANRSETDRAERETEEL
ncbi:MULTISPECIES: NfeD family protein [unclassified Haladaptatus]|uniref:NfeD family protein n=1 Tax=unclassified Haladaptatus TaxID=2622732 RepID=UPI00209C42BF|nr:MULTISPECIES: NfeD family protein [unclassified Haladaptatus]MCO8244507.1 NfeD family protein [Haladaptatus sp. AB643]MCO8253871.1 NfeD family protein [Haladaptatus sp. AB618]